MGESMPNLAGGKKRRKGCGVGGGGGMWKSRSLGDARLAGGWETGVGEGSSPR